MLCAEETLLATEELDFELLSGLAISWLVARMLGVKSVVLIVCGVQESEFPPPSLAAQVDAVGLEAPLSSMVCLLRCSCVIISRKEGAEGD